MKWKLIKTYPLCPFELGAVAEHQPLKNDDNLCIRLGVGEYSMYPKDAIVDNPEFWEEVKEGKPILITEDGVEIFDLESCFFVQFNHKPYEAIINKSIGIEWFNDKRFFSTKEKAEEHIKWNKPMYSLNDVTRAIMSGNGIIEELEKLDRK